MNLNVKKWIAEVNNQMAHGGGDAPSYNDLADKPSIEGIILSGNKTFPNLNLKVLTNTEIQNIFDNLT